MEQVNDRRLPDRWARALAWVPILALAGASLTATARETPLVAWSLLGSAGAFALWLLWLLRSGKPLEAQTFVRRPHWVQILCHSSIYVYWGTEVDLVPRMAPLILAQIPFVYALDLLLSWTRGRRWLLSFGPVPIVGSTNLFIWFKPDWYLAQLALMASTFLSRELLRWKRDGQERHIFNPSGFGLAVTSVILLATGTTSLTYGPEIATTLARPTYMFHLIFATGIVVQSLFKVGPITLGAAVTVFFGDWLWHEINGEWIFFNETIPIAVFLGMTLLVTDPATSPRRPLAKLVYGILYGAAVFPIYLVLLAFGIPAFYDKLLQVPILNLMLPWIERVCDRVRIPGPWTRWSPGRLNAAHVGIWSGVFVWMLPSLVNHPGQSPAYWEPKCEEGDAEACMIVRHLLESNCAASPAEACLELGDALAGASGLVADDTAAVAAYGRACQAGAGRGCAMVAVAQEQGRGGLEADPARAAALWKRGCESGDETSCTELAGRLVDGRGMAAAPEQAVALLEAACDRGMSSPCAVAGYMLLNGQGIPANPEAGRRYARLACERGLQPACTLGASP